MARFFSDVNVLVCAFREDAALHSAAYGSLRRARAEGNILFVNAQVMSSFVRIVTNKRIYEVPSSSEEAIAFLDALLSTATVQLTQTDALLWPAFRKLCLEHQLNGDDVPDALLAAQAMILDAELLSFDKGFYRFTGLKWSVPIVTPEVDADAD